jgi:hypothetical protein
MKFSTIASLLLLLFIMNWAQVESQTNTMELGKDTEVPLSGSLVNTNDSISSIAGFIMGMTPSQPSNGQNISMYVDLTYGSILVPGSTSGEPGLQCTEANACTVGTKADTCTYAMNGQNGISVQCEVDSQVLLRFKPTELTSTSQWPSVNFNLFTSSDKWQAAFGQNGIFGLSPSSGFWSYLNTAFTKQQGQDYIDVSTSYTFNDLTKVLYRSGSRFQESFLTVNGRRGINEPIVRSFNNKYNNLWVFDQATVALSRYNITQSASLCVDNTRRTYLLLQNANDHKNSILTKMCGSTTPCNKNNANLGALDNFKITLTSDGTDQKSIDVYIRPNEYVNFDDQGLVYIGIDDITNSQCKSAYTTLSDSTMGVGLLFLAKAEFIVRIPQNTQTTTFEVGFNETTYPSDTIFLTILIALGVIILGIIVGIIFANSCRKKDGEKQKDSPGEDYAKAKDVDN